jgi:hypothetical protein
MRKLASSNSGGFRNGKGPRERSLVDDARLPKLGRLVMRRRKLVKQIRPTAGGKDDVHCCDIKKNEAADNEEHCDDGFAMFPRLLFVTLRRFGKVKILIRCLIHFFSSWQDATTSKLFVHISTQTQSLSSTTKCGLILPNQLRKTPNPI